MKNFSRLNDRLVAAIQFVLVAVVAISAALRPNIIFIMSDDVGYGDLLSYQFHSKIPTPNIDTLAAHGMVFLNGHSAGAVCTPSRYSFVTGEYAFRKGDRLGILEGRCQWVKDNAQREWLLQRVAEVWPSLKN